MSLKADSNDSDHEGVRRYRRWVDRETCSLRRCGRKITCNDGCVVISTNERLRKRLPRTRKSAIVWVSSGRPVFHRSCYKDLEESAQTYECDSGVNLFESKTEATLFRAGQDTAEFYDGRAAVQQAAVETARLFWSVSENPTGPSPVVVAFTGAGVSCSAGIPTYRGTDGIDTKEGMGDDEEVFVDYSTLQPTATHRHLATLERSGWMSYLASQNCDNLHAKAGTSRERITELHGNVFVEYCEKCKKEYVRDYEVDAYSTECHDEKYFVKCKDCGFGHYTGRQCSVKGCRGKLKDTIVNFGDCLFTETLGGLVKASDKFMSAWVCLALGSSLQVSPANLLVSLPNFLVVVNLQTTESDSDAAIRVWAESDQFMEYLMAELQKGPSKEKSPLVTRDHIQAHKKKTEAAWQELMLCIEYYSKEQEAAKGATNLHPPPGDGGHTNRKRRKVST